MSHVFLDKSYYFVTCRTTDGKEYLRTDEAKDVIFNNFIRVKNLFSLEYLDFVILNNHFHFAVFINNSSDLPKMMQLINGNTSKQLNLKLSYRLWGKYYERLIKSEKSFFKISGYIAGNPLKHKLVKNFDELERYKYGSFGNLVADYGKIGAIEIVTAVKSLNLE